MDSSRDNPFIRFATFWWALGTFLIFGVLTVLIWGYYHQDPQTLEDVAAKARYKTKEEIFKAQAAALPKEAIDKAIETVGAQLAAAKPAAVETEAQKVPKPAAPIDPAVMEAGKIAYIGCAACHGQNGEGTLLGPPLAGSEWVTGPVENLMKIQMRGLAGPITVAGKEYTFPAPMPPMGAGLPDDQVAAVITFIRNSFGNKAPAVKPADVTPFRSEIGKPILSPAELTKP